MKPVAKKLLVIDSDPAHVTVLLPKLRAAGYEVITAEAGRGAAMLAAFHRPALILLDLVLRDVDGRDVLAELRRRVAGIPVIVWSARDYEADRLIAVERGAVAYLPKADVAQQLIPLLLWALNARDASKKP